MVLSHGVAVGQSVKKGGGEDCMPSPVESAVQSPSGSGSFGDLPSVDLSSAVMPSPKKKRRLPADAGINYGLTPFCEDGGVYNAAWRGLPLTQFRFWHEASPSVFFKFRSKFEEWLVAMQSSAGSMPGSMQEFETAYKCAFVWTKPSEQQPASTVSWSMAWYVAGGALELKTILECMDTFCAWLHKALLATFPVKLRARVSNHTSFQISLDGVDMEVQTEIADGEAPGYRVIEVAPPTFKQKYPHAFLEFSSGNVVTIVFKGDHYIFREHFDQYGIPGRYAQKDGSAVVAQSPEAKKEATYVRVLRDADLASPGVQTNLLNMFQAAIFASTPVLASCVNAQVAAPNSAGEAFLKGLQGLENVYFV